MGYQNQGEGRLRWVRNRDAQPGWRPTHLTFDGVTTLCDERIADDRTENWLGEWRPVVACEDCQREIRLAVGL